METKPAEMETKPETKTANEPETEPGNEPAAGEPKAAAILKKTRAAVPKVRAARPVKSKTAAAAGSPANEKPNQQAKPSEPAAGGVMDDVFSLFGL